ncbi:MAG: TonB-dependent receptor, partial [Desulfobacteraceae bacterium]|nr:TonB-dependent receptor [Desulfobacteraceae bacterium]
MKKQLKIAFMSFLMLAFLSAFLYSQAKYSTIEGKVIDTESVPLPGVEVKLSSPDLIGGTQSKITDAMGKFRFPALPPGRYTLETYLGGFVPAKRENIRLFVGQTITVDLTLQIGTLEEEVTVIGIAPLVDVKDSQVNVTNLDEQLIKDIAAATKGRSATSGLLNLAPNTESSSAAGSPARVSVQWQIDGNVVSYIGSGADWTYPDINMVEEAQVVGFGSNAEYGGFTGAVFNTVLKSGGNTFGGLAEIVYSGLGWRNENIDVSEPKFSLYEDPPRELSFQAHVGVGGPIIKDKLWFYFGGGQRQDDYEISGFEERESYQLPNAALKLTFQLDEKNRFHALAWFEDFLVYNRGLSVYRPPETTFFDYG